ncbi:MAG: glycine cleavage system protein R [Gammaproteobacteria bacterium]|nr:glycine cleavage system protein R [Gammaproteobacteria bacterium]
MKRLLVISALGEDRPGIVDDLSELILDAGCNIEDSRAAVLGGEFAVMLLVSGQWNEIAKLEDALPRSAEALGMQIFCRRTDTPDRRDDRLPYMVEVVALDHPGIVHQLAHFFSARGINIEDLVTHTYPAAHTGSPMFAVTLTVGIPASQHIGTLREEFLDHCDQLNLDAVMEPVKN